MPNPILILDTKEKGNKDTIPCGCWDCFIKRRYLSLCQDTGLGIWHWGIRGIGVSEVSGYLALGYLALGYPALEGYGIGELLLDYGTDVIPFDEAFEVVWIVDIKTMMGI